MDGSEYVGQVTAYLSRILGEPVSSDQPVRLRSVERAALASWARKQGVPIRSALTGSDAPFTATELLDVGGSSRDHALKPATPIAARRPENHVASGTLTAVGIDIEDVDSLPATDDYREHPFFQDHFTPSEIAYCIRQPDVAASFCGTWAAKEAVLKSGLIPITIDPLNTIEIGRDQVGRPLHPGCQLSISHTKRSAVAICIAVASQPGIELSAPKERSGITPPESSRRAFPTTAVACFSAVVLGALALATWHLAG